MNSANAYAVQINMFHWSLMKFLDNYVIRVGGGVTVFRIKRFIQMMALIVCVASVTLLLYQNAYGMRVIDVSCVSDY